MTEIALREHTALVQRGEYDVADVLAQVKKIQHVMKEAMKNGEHYGVIPNTNKPTLLKPGAEKLCLTFRLDPQYAITTIREGDHVTKEIVCTLYHIPTGLRMGSGLGSCSTREAKYAYRKGQRLCTECNADAIRKDKNTGGWYCWRKIGGCGAQFKAGDKNIESQQVDRVPNPDLADTENTVLKMAKKRALVDAVLTVTAASDIFTQDLEDTDSDLTRGGGKEEARSHNTSSIASHSEPLASVGSVAPVPPARESIRPEPDDPELVQESERLFPDPEQDAIKQGLVHECGAIITAQLKAKVITQKDVRAFKATYLGGENADPTKCDASALTDLRAFLRTRFER